MTDEIQQLTERRNFLLLLVSAPAAFAVACTGITEPTSVSTPTVQPAPGAGGSSTGTPGGGAASSSSSISSTSSSSTSSTSSSSSASGSSSGSSSSSSSGSSSSSSSKQKKEGEKSQDPSEKNGQQQKPSKSQQQQQNDASKSGENNESANNQTRGDEVAQGGELSESRIEWGKLPERVRELVLQGRRDRVSSIYERLTREYYRRLAEEASR